MRKLNTADIFAACRVTKSLGLKEKVRELAQNSSGIADVWDKGFDLLWGIFDAATEQQGEAQLYVFLAGPFEMSAEDVASLELPALFDCLKQLAEENDLPAFFRYVRGLMK